MADDNDIKINLPTYQLEEDRSNKEFIDIIKLIDAQLICILKNFQDETNKLENNLKSSKEKNKHTAATEILNFFSKTDFSIEDNIINLKEKLSYNISMGKGGVPAATLVNTNVSFSLVVENIHKLMLKRLYLTKLSGRELNIEHLAIKIDSAQKKYIKNINIKNINKEFDKIKAYYNPLADNYNILNKEYGTYIANISTQYEDCKQNIESSEKTIMEEIQKYDAQKKDLDNQIVKFKNKIIELKKNKNYTEIEALNVEWKKLSKKIEAHNNAITDLENARKILLDVFKTNENIIKSSISKLDNFIEINPSKLFNIRTIEDLIKIIKLNIGFLNDIKKLIPELNITIQKTLKESNLTSLPKIENIALSLSLIDNLKNNLNNLDEIDKQISILTSNNNSNRLRSYLTNLQNVLSNIQKSSNKHLGDDSQSIFNIVSNLNAILVEIGKINTQFEDLIKGFTAFYMKLNFIVDFSNSNEKIKQIQKSLNDYSISATATDTLSKLLTDLSMENAKHLEKQKEKLEKQKEKLEKQRKTQNTTLDKQKNELKKRAKYLEIEIIELQTKYKLLSKLSPEAEVIADLIKIIDTTKLVNNKLKGIEQNIKNIQKELKLDGKEKELEFDGKFIYRNEIEEALNILENEVLNIKNELEASKNKQPLVIGNEPIASENEEDIDIENAPDSEAALDGTEEKALTGIEGALKDNVKQENPNKINTNDLPIMENPSGKTLNGPKDSFFKRHWKKIATSAGIFSVAGAGAAIGVAVGLLGAPFTFGASLLISAGIGFGACLVAGACVGAGAGAVNDRMNRPKQDKKPVVKKAANDASKFSEVISNHRGQGNKETVGLLDAPFTFGTSLLLAGIGFGAGLFTFGAYDRMNNRKNKQEPDESKKNDEDKGEKPVVVAETSSSTEAEVTNPASSPVSIVSNPVDRNNNQNPDESRSKDKGKEQVVVSSISSSGMIEPKKIVFKKVPNNISLEQHKRLAGLSCAQDESRSKNKGKERVVVGAQAPVQATKSSPPPSSSIRWKKGPHITEEQSREMAIAKLREKAEEAKKEVEQAEKKYEAALQKAAEAAFGSTPKSAGKLSFFSNCNKKPSNNSVMLTEEKKDEQQSSFKPSSNQWNTDTQSFPSLDQK